MAASPRAKIQLAHFTRTQGYGGPLPVYINPDEVAAVPRAYEDRLFPTKITLRSGEVQYVDQGCAEVVRLLREAGRV